jgi:serine/threonine-protein kinase
MRIRKPVADTSILLTCGACAYEFRFPARLTGRQVACPHCRQTLAIAPAKPAEDRLVGQEVGGFRLIRRLGAGAIGVVYEAEQLAMGRRVAVKMLSSRASASADVVQRFQREARLSAQIHHPHVVGVFDCGFERGVHYLVMEFVEGQTLASMIEEAGRLPWTEAARLVAQVGQALGHVHGLGIVHRDIKPANILVDGAGVAKLADLGLAKQVEGENGDLQQLTMQNVALGSPAYMPPEQIRNARDATASCDLYALGASFYQAVTGVLPFDGTTAAAVMGKVLSEEPKPVTALVAGFPLALSAFILRTLAKRPEDRPQDAAAFVAELEEAIHPTPRPDPHAPTVIRPARTARSAPTRRIWPVVVALLAILVTAAVLLWRFR